MSLSKIRHKELLDEALTANVTYKILDGVMPCRIIIDGNYFNVYVKNLSSAHFEKKNEISDVWRAQLPYCDDFVEMKESPIPFIFLGYDELNDVYATWNPHKVKQRLNEAKYVSFYSRLSAQKEAHNEDKFVRQELNNDGEVLLFPRSKLNSYLVNMQAYFPDMSDYVAIGSKRRTEANEAYRELNNVKNIVLYAKYLENIGCEYVSQYCKCIKQLINQNEFSRHRRDFLACDTIFQYEKAVESFVNNNDIIGFDKAVGGYVKNAMLSYVRFLKTIFEEADDENDTDEYFAESPDENVCNDDDEIDYDAPCYKNGKIIKVTNPQILRLIEPHLNIEYPEPLVAIDILRFHYVDKFDVHLMEIKDWMNLIKKIDWNTCYDKPAQHSEIKHSKKKTHFLRVTFSDGRILQHRNSARTFAKVIEECFPDLIAEMGICVAGVNIVSTELSEKYSGAQMPICNGLYYVMTNITTSSKCDILEQIDSELGLDFKAELIPIEEFEDSEAYACDLPSASRKRIRVTFPDGKVLQNTQVQQTLVDVVMYAKAEKVRGLGLKISGMNIITNDLAEVDGENKYKFVGDGYYVNTRSSTHDKYTQINEINERLGLNLYVELV